MPTANALSHEASPHDTATANDNYTSSNELIDTNQRQNDQSQRERGKLLSVNVSTPESSVAGSTRDSSIEEDDVFRYDNNYNNNNNLFLRTLAKQSSSSSSLLHSPSGLSSVSMNSALSAFVNEEEMEMRRALAEQRRHKKLEIACEKAVSDLHLSHPTMSAERQRAAQAEVEASMKSVMARVAKRRALRLNAVATHSVL